MPLTLYLDLLSQPCRAIAIFARINGIEYEEKLVHLMKGEHRADWFLEKTPFGLVPLLEDDGYILAESSAILRYLAAKYTVPESWYPSDLRQRGRVDEYLSWHYCPPGLRYNSNQLFIENSIKPFRTGNSADREEVAEKIVKLKPVLDRLENYFLSRGDYIAGTSDVTLADLVCICEIMQPICAGYDVTENRPKLKAWVERVKTRLQPHFYRTHNDFLESFSKFRM